MSDNVGNVSLGVNLDKSDLKKSLVGLEKQTTSGLKGAFSGSGIASVFSKLGALAAGAFAVGSIVKFGASAIKLGSDLAEVQNVVDVTFGSMSGQINAFAQSAMTSFGLSETATKRYTGTMGAMLKSMGLGVDKAADMSMAMTGLAGDFASFYNLDADEAFSKIRAGISGETEPLKQLGINMSVANLEAFGLSQGINKSYNAMTQAEQALLRYNYLMQVSADAQGDFARTSTSWANQTRVLKLQWDSFKASFGQGLINMFSPILVGINRIMGGLIKLGSMFSAFTAALFGTQKAAGGLGQSLAGIANSGGEAADGQSALADATKSAGKAAGGSIMSFDQLNVMQDTSAGGSEGAGGAGAAFEIPGATANDGAGEVKAFSGIEAAAQKTRAALAGFGQFFTGLFKTEIMPVAKMFGDFFTGSIIPRLKQSWDTLFPKLQETASIGFGLVKNVAGDFWTSFKNNLPDALAQWSRWFGNISDVFDEGVGTWLDIFNSGLGTLQEWWSEWGKGLLDGTWKTVIGIWDTVNLFFEQWIKPIFSMAMKAVKDVWDNSFKGMFKSVLDFVATAIDGANQLWQKFIKPLVDFVIVTLAPNFKIGFKMILDIVVAVFKTIGGIFDGFFKILRGAIDFIVGIFTGDWKKAWGGITTIVDGQMKIVRSIWDGLVGIVKAPLNALISAFNGAIGKMNKISVKIPDWVPTFGGKTFGLKLPTIPALAEGGIVSQPTLAMVGDNKRSAEAVAPLSDLMSMIKAAVGSSSGNAEMTRQMAEMVKLLRQLVELGDPVIYLYLDNLFAAMTKTSMRKNARAGRMRLATGG